MRFQRPAVILIAVSLLSLTSFSLLVESFSLSWSQPFQQRKQNSHKNGNQRLSTELYSNFFDDLKNTILTTTTNPKIQRPSKVTIPDDFVIPTPQPLTITESTDILQFTKNTIALFLRLATGTFVLGWKIDTIFYDPELAKPNNEYYLSLLGPFNIRDTSSVLLDSPRPKQPLILYEYDASPYCKIVRETINLLDLSVEYRPCPGARQGRFSNQLYDMTGRRTVPYLFDPNTGIGLFESADQIEYLLETYGPSPELYDRKALWPITWKQFSIFTSTQVAILLNFPGSQRQSNARPDNEQMIPLELWGYETSPFVRPVREKLCSLCLPHIMISCSRGSTNRDKLVQKTGRFQVPYLVDPNTGIEMFESQEIVKYLDNVYTVAE